MHNRMQSRIGVAVATLAVGALALTGCSASSSAGANQPELSKDKVTITLNWWGADARNKLTEDAVKAFEKEHPNITVETTNADWTGYWDKLATSTAGGNAPDVSQFDQLYVASYAKKGALLDLSTVSNTLKTKNIPATTLGTGDVGKTLYAMPIGVTPSGVAINTSVFDEYGVPVPDTTSWTWDDLEQAAVEITEKSGGKVHGLGPFGADSFSLGVWARQHGNDIFDSNGNVTLKASVLQSYWEQELAWINEKASPSASQLSEGASLTLDQNDFATSKVAMSFIPAGQFSAYATANPKSKLELANWPTGPDTTAGFQYMKPSMYWAISSKTQHPAEAAALVNFLVNSDTAGKILGVDRGVPANTAVQKAIEPNLSGADQLNLAFTQDMTKVAGDAPPITPNGASAIETTLARYNQQVTFGQTTPKKAATAFIAELKSSISSAG